MRKAKKLLSLFLTLTLLCSMTVIPPVASAESGITPASTSDFTVAVDTSKVGTLHRGDTFTVDVTAKNNPGITNFNQEYTYNSAVFDFIKAEAGEGTVLNGKGTITAISGKGNVVFEATDQEANVTGDGVLYTLAFKVKDNATYGEAELGLATATGDYVIDKDANKLAVTYTSGTVTVAETKAAVTPTISGTWVNSKDKSLAYSFAKGARVPGDIYMGVDASTTDEGTLSYQWYKLSSAEAAHTEGNITRLANDNGNCGNSYSLGWAASECSNIGSYYFFCRVVNTRTIEGAESKAYADSAVMTITVTPAAPSVGVTCDTQYYVKSSTETASPIKAVVRNTYTGDCTLSYEWKTYYYDNDKKEGVWTDLNQKGTFTETDYDSTTGLYQTQYTPSISEAGITRYYCFVTLTDTATQSKVTGVNKRDVAITVYASQEEVDPGTPTVQMKYSGASSYKQGQTSNVSQMQAYITRSGGGTITYQWFKNSTNSIEGGTPIGDVQTWTSGYPALTPDTSEVGTTYYYVKAWSTLLGKTVESQNPDSNKTIAITVNEVKKPTLEVSNASYADGKLSFDIIANDLDEWTSGTLQVCPYLNGAALIPNEWPCPVTISETTGGTGQVLFANNMLKFGISQTSLRATVSYECELPAGEHTISIDSAQFATYGNVWIYKYENGAYSFVKETTDFASATTQTTANVPYVYSAELKDAPSTVFAGNTFTTDVYMTATDSLCSAELNIKAENATIAGIEFSSDLQAAAGTTMSSESSIAADGTSAKLTFVGNATDASAGLKVATVTYKAASEKGTAAIQIESAVAGKSESTDEGTVGLPSSATSVAITSGTVASADYGTAAKKIITFAPDDAVQTGSVAYVVDGVPTTMYWSSKYNAWVLLVDTNAAAPAVENFSINASSEKVSIAYPGDAGAADVNSSGAVNIVDAQIAYDIATAKYTDFTALSMQQWLMADVNGGGVDATDAFAIQHYIHTKSWGE